jgi:hypothetical protein
MKNSQEMRGFLDKVDSIHSKFLESLITGQRDPIFAERKRKPGPEDQVESDSNQSPLHSGSGSGE